MFDRLINKSKGRKQGKGQGRGNRPGAGPEGNCICPNCGFRSVHQINQRCTDQKCPKCGTQMLRE